MTEARLAADRASLDRLSRAHGVSKTEIVKAAAEAKRKERSNGWFHLAL